MLGTALVAFEDMIDS